MQNAKLITLQVLQGSTNCYILACEKTHLAVVIDPGGDVQMIADRIKDENLTLQAIINTHGHWDHIGGNRALLEHFPVDLYIHADDEKYLHDSQLNLAYAFGGDGNGSQATRLLHDLDKIALGELTLTVIHTPGHTPGGICLLVQDALFSGDTLFWGSVGRCDLPGGDFSSLISSLKDRILPLDGQIIVYPGHGPSTTISDEKAYNPYLRP